MSDQNYYEHEVLTRLVAGDSDAFRLVYERYQEKVFSFALYLTKSKSTAEEVVQEVFIRLWEKRGQIDAQQYFPAYIKRITQNQVINYYRKASTQASLAKQFWAGISEARTAHEDPLLVKELDKAYQAAVNALPPHQRVVYLLHRDQELSYKEIAERTGVSVHTVRNQLASANKFVRDNIQSNKGLQSLLILLYSAGYFK